MRTIRAEEVKPLLTGEAEIAFLDVREAGQFGEGHAFFAINLPYSRLEVHAPYLMPRRSVRCVLMDDGGPGGIASRAASRLIALGYSDVSVMEGGAPAWSAAGFTLFKGVNVPSKSFGELVEHTLHTPSISAAELKAEQEAGADLMLLDGRTPGEFRRMSVPGARFCPNGELGYRLPAYGPGPGTRIVVNCAGRTRSIIGAQTLRNLGVPQEVVALRNGTQGWTLAGYELDRGRTPEVLPELTEANRGFARHAAQLLIARSGLELVDLPGLIRERCDTSRTHYLFDVRTAPEFSAGHIPGALCAPGGQLVQATDRWIAVRGARIVLCDDVGFRAATTALWLRGMGHNVAVLDADASLVRDEVPTAAIYAPPRLPAVDPRDVPARLAAGAVLLDLTISATYRAGHVAGARWSTRPRLPSLDLSGATEVLLAARERIVAHAAALDIAEHFGLPCAWLGGGPQDWREAGLEVVETPDNPPDAERIDYLFFVHDRHDGNLAAAQEYLDWELGLVAQLDAQERAVLRPERALPGDAP